MLIHLIDATDSDPVAAWRTIRGELLAYGAGLESKPEIVALNKVDALDAAARKKAARAVEKASGQTPHLVSAVSGEGLKPLLRAAFARVRPAEATTVAAPADGTWTP